MTLKYNDERQSWHRLVPVSKEPGRPSGRTLWRCLNCRRVWPFPLTDDELEADPCPKGAA